jgi:hypothetical protein
MNKSFLVLFFKKELLPFAAFARLGHGGLKPTLPVRPTR